MFKRLKRGKKEVWGEGDKPNSKVKNATKVEIDGVKFRSKIEAFTFKKLRDEGFNFKYEEVTFTIQEKFEFFDGEKVRPITYTPDFVDDKNLIIVEVKGFANETFPIRMKLFKNYLYRNNLKYKIFIVSSQKQIEELIIKLKI